MWLSLDNYCIPILCMALRKKMYRTYIEMGIILLWWEQVTKRSDRGEIEDR